MAFISDSFSSLAALSAPGTNYYSMTFDAPGVYRIGDASSGRLSEFTSIDAYIWGAGGGSANGNGGGGACVKVAGIVPYEGSTMDIIVGSAGGAGGSVSGGSAGQSWKLGGSGTPVELWLAGGKGGDSSNVDRDAGAGGGGGGASGIYLGGDWVAIAAGGGGGGGSGDDFSGGGGSATPGQGVLSSYSGTGKGGDGSNAYGGAGGAGGGGLQGGAGGGGSRSGGGAGGGGGYSYVDTSRVTDYRVLVGSGATAGGVGDIAYKAGFGNHNQNGRVVLVFRRLPHVWVKIAGATGGIGGIGGQPGGTGRYFGAGGGGAGVQQVSGSTQAAAYAGGAGYPGYVRLSYFQSGYVDKRANGFRTVGETRWSVPPGVQYVDVQTVGGGGGGGSSYRQNDQLSGGGGGSGAYVEGNISVTTGQVLTILVGAGGAGASTTSQSVGGTGGNTSVNGSFIAQGGAGGGSATISVVGAGGNGGGSNGNDGVSGESVANATLTSTGRKAGDATGGAGGASPWPTTGNQVWKRVDRIWTRTSSGATTQTTTGYVTDNPEDSNPNNNGFYTRTGANSSNAAVSRQWWVVINGVVVYNSTVSPPLATEFVAGTYRGSAFNEAPWHDAINTFDVTVKTPANKLWKPIALIHAKTSDNQWKRVYANAAISSTKVSGTAYSAYMLPTTAESYVEFTPKKENYIFLGDFTIEMYFYQQGRPRAYNTIFELGDYRVGMLVRCGSSGNNDFYINGTNYGAISSSVTLNDWHHLAVSREGSTVRLFIDGVAVKTVTNSTSINLMNNPLRVGSSKHTTGQKFTGYISDVRIVKDTALYNDTFVPEAAKLGPADVGTTTLLGLQDAGFVDNSITTSGKASIATSAVAMQGFSPFGTFG